ncbi:hypothetical protein B0H17DRAFT_1133891 [Mycena rosella]|uniref:Uncharacterized protein n=1 Tax=Mycena rosella TaxID=1033263 RepID=A0AAD7DGW0_MYCRO|nr:hypothetical protein B0H17DRAFT_1133891 [Mycena rosella]
MSNGTEYASNEHALNTVLGQASTSAVLASAYFGRANSWAHSIIACQKEHRVELLGEAIAPMGSLGSGSCFMATFALGLGVCVSEQTMRTAGSNCRPHHHTEYYLDDGNLIVLVGAVLFRLWDGTFCQHTTVFPLDKAPDDTHLLVLLGVTAAVKRLLGLEACK